MGQREDSLAVKRGTQILCRNTEKGCKGRVFLIYYKICQNSELMANSRGTYVKLPLTICAPKKFKQVSTKKAERGQDTLSIDLFDYLFFLLTHGQFRSHVNRIGDPVLSTKETIRLKWASIPRLEQQIIRA